MSFFFAGSMDKEGRSFFDISLNRYLVYGGAGGLGLVMLLILVASLVCAIVRYVSSHCMYSVTE